MKRKFKYAVVSLVFIACVVISALYLKTHNIAVMNPKGFIAEQQRLLIIKASILMAIVVIPVFIMTLFFAWKYREKNEKADYRPDWAHSYVAEIFWWGIPCIIIVLLGVITWRSSHALNPFKPLESDKKPIVIQAVALQYKWLFLYPEYGVATINYLQFPEQVPLNFEITAEAPMNSFWIPELGGQIYAMPAARTKLHLIAHEQGTFRGSSANLSGHGFAGMFFEAKATSQEEFDTWITQVKGSNQLLTQESYETLVEPSSYVPVTLYQLMEPNLFNNILMKYSPPQR